MTDSLETIESIFSVYQPFLNPTPYLLLTTTLVVWTVQTDCMLVGYIALVHKPWDSCLEWRLVDDSTAVKITWGETSI